MIQRHVSGEVLESGGGGGVDRVWLQLHVGSEDYDLAVDAEGGVAGHQAARTIQHDEDAVRIHGFVEGETHHRTHIDLNGAFRRRQREQFGRARIFGRECRLEGNHQGPSSEIAGSARADCTVPRRSAVAVQNDHLVDGLALEKLVWSEDHFGVVVVESDRG